MTEQWLEAHFTRDGALVIDFNVTEQWLAINFTHDRTLAGNRFYIGRNTGWRRILHMTEHWLAIDFTYDGTPAGDRLHTLAFNFKIFLLLEIVS